MLLKRFSVYTVVAVFVFSTVLSQTLQEFSLASLPQSPTDPAATDPAANTILLPINFAQSSASVNTDEPTERELEDIFVGTEKFSHDLFEILHKHDTITANERFAHLLLELLETSPAISLPPNTTIDNAYDSLYLEAYTILQRMGINDTTIAERSGKAAEKVADVLDLYLYYSAISHMTAKLLKLNGALTSREIVVNGPFAVMDLVKFYAELFGTEDTDAVLFVVSNAVYDYFTSYEDLKEAFHYFDEYLVVLGQEKR